MAVLTTTVVPMHDKPEVPATAVTTLDDDEGVFLLEETDVEDPFVFLVTATVDPGPEASMSVGVTWTATMGALPFLSPGHNRVLGDQLWGPHAVPLSRTRAAHCDITDSHLFSKVALRLRSSQLVTALCDDNEIHGTNLTLAFQPFPAFTQDWRPLQETGNGIDAGAAVEVAERCDSLWLGFLESEAYSTAIGGLFPTDPLFRLTCAQRERARLVPRLDMRSGGRLSPSGRQLLGLDQHRLTVLDGVIASLADELT